MLAPHLVYQQEVSNMAYTMEQFLREAEEIMIARVMKRDPEAILKHLDPEERLKGLDPAIIEAWLAKQRRDH